MLIRVESKEFVDVLNTICSTKQIVNFTINRQELLIQIFDPLIISIPIRINSIESQFVGDDDYSISVELNRSYNLISDNGLVTLIIGKELLMIRSEGYECKFKSAYEDRFDIPTNFSDKFEELDSGRNLENVVRISQAVSTYSKFIQVEDPSVYVKNRTAYVMCGGIVFKSRLDFPDSVWLRAVLKSINTVFRTHHINKPTLLLNKQSGVYGVVPFANNAQMAFAMRYASNSIIEAVNKTMSDMPFICNAHIGVLSDKIKIIDKVYKKAEVKIAFGENSYYVSIRVGTENELVFGSMVKGEKITLLSASIPLLTLINNIFKNSSEVEVYSVARYMMFKDSCNTLLVTGVEQM